MKRELKRIEIPGEHDARVRTWETLRTAFEQRERVAWPRRHARALTVAAAGVAVVAAAFTPPGRSVVDDVRRAIGVENAQRELVRLPAPGRLLVDSTSGTWIVQHDGSRRLLGPYHDPSWSPRGLFVAAVRSDRELIALEPDGNVRWVRPHRQRLRSPRWSYEGFRIAYFAGKTLRVIVGNGSGDREIGPADTDVAPAWRPRTHEVAYLDGGRVRVVDVDRRVRLRPTAADRRRLAAPARDASTAARAIPGSGRIGSATRSPDGRWLAVAWPAADQLVFVRVEGKPKLVAISNMTRQFGSFPNVAGWSR